MKEIKGFEHYSIDRNGNIWNNKFSKPRLLSPYKVALGYMEVQLWKDNKRYRHRVHRLLAEAYIDNKENFSLVRHLNDVKDDNRLENLAWGNHSMNSQDYYRNKRRTK